MGWEKFTLRADRQVQSAGEYRCAAADNDTHLPCLSSHKPEEYVIHNSGKWPLQWSILSPRSFALILSLSWAGDSPSERTGEQRICLIWVDIFKSVKHLSTEANKARRTALRYASWQRIKQCWADYCSLSNADLFYQTKAETNLLLLRCSWEKMSLSHVKQNHACHEANQVLIWAAERRALFAAAPFLGKTMLSLHSLTAPRGWCGGEGTCRGPRASPVPQTKIGHNLRFNFSSQWSQTTAATGV